MAVRPNAVYRVALANGHRLWAYRAGRDRARPADYAPGDRVTLEVSPSDLSKGRLVISNASKS